MYIRSLVGKKMKMVSGVLKDWINVREICMLCLQPLQTVGDPPSAFLYHQTSSVFLKFSKTRLTIHLGI